MSVGANPIGATPAQLVKWASQTQRANLAVQTARLLMMNGDAATGDAQSPDDLLLEAQELTEQTRRELVAAAGPHAGMVSTVAPIPLDQYATPDARELLSLLQRAQAVAERVDAGRGRVLPAEVPLGPGESRGTDLAEAVSELAARLHGEVFGARGRE